VKEGQNGSSVVVRAGESSNIRSEVFCFWTDASPSVVNKIYFGNFDVRRKLL